MLAVIDLLRGLFFFSVAGLVFLSLARLTSSEKRKSLSTTIFLHPSNEELWI